jgi:hypothetical protein
MLRRRFTVALFFWYWLRTRKARTWPQWALLGILFGLAMDVYYLNVVLLALPLLESLGIGATAAKISREGDFKALLGKNAVFAASALIAFVPTLLAKKIIYGSFLNFGYRESWAWNSPALLRVCFSADHGLFSWTPIVLLAVAGTAFLLIGTTRSLRSAREWIFLGYLYLVGCYQDWDGISSFGNRFFVSLTAIFVVGLAALFEFFGRAWQGRQAGELSRPP